MRRSLFIVAALASVLVTLQCYSNEKSTPRANLNTTPSPAINAIYSEHTIAALQRTHGIRVDRIARAGDSSADLFALNEYRVVQPGRALSVDEAKRLRTLLLDPASYTTMMYLCSFDPQVAFTLDCDDSSYYFVLANECHLAAMQTSQSREDVNLTEKTALVLGAFCEALFQ